jgi:hypothetical protein
MLVKYKNINLSSKNIIKTNGLHGIDYFVKWLFENGKNIISLFSYKLNYLEPEWWAD